MEPNTLSIARNCPTVAAHAAWRAAIAERSRIDREGGPLFGPHSEAEWNAADQFSRSVPRSVAGALLLLDAVAARELYAVPSAHDDASPKDGAPQPPALAQEAQRLAAMLRTGGRCSSFLNALAALLAAYSSELPPYHRARRAAASVAAWAAPELVRPIDDPATVADLAHPCPAVRAHAAWRLIDARSPDDYGAVARASLAFADTVPAAARGAFLKIDNSAFNAEAVAALEAEAAGTEHYAEWRALSDAAPELRTLANALSGGAPMSDFVMRLARVGTILARALLPDHAVLRSVVATLQWARRPRAAGDESSGMC